MMRWLWRRSIWHPDAIPPLEAKYATPLKRVVFPLFNVAIILLGVAGAVQGFDAVRQAIPTPFPTVLYGAFITGGAVCMVGCAFPRLWPVEIAGKMFLLGVLAVLMITMLVTAANSPGHPGFAVAVILAVMMLFPSLRLWILGIEWAPRRTT
ncbi:hypothetical protein ACIGCK_04730 [Microbacterium sp. NPDC078428]|uniref:hypothetical protein n=1 Tax=Microbacterium sp. NPDC078428 TaxID=3364190 RepID=UPI0037C9C54C